MTVHVARIRHLRALMLVHSHVYYVKGSSWVSDDAWQEWANELEFLQTLYPDEKVIGFFDNAFEDWDGTTGMHLPLRDSWVLNKIAQLEKNTP